MGESIQVSQDPFILVSRDGTLEVATMELPIPDGGTAITTAVFRDGRTVTRVRSLTREAARVTHNALLSAYQVSVDRGEVWAAAALESLIARGYLQINHDIPRLTPKGRSIWYRLQPEGPEQHRPLGGDLQEALQVWPLPKDLPEKCVQCDVREALREACLGVGLGTRRSHRQAEAGVAIAEITPGQREDRQSA